MLKRNLFKKSIAITLSIMLTGCTSTSQISQDTTAVTDKTEVSTSSSTTGSIEEVTEDNTTEEATSAEETATEETATEDSTSEDSTTTDTEETTDDTEPTLGDETTTEKEETAENETADETTEKETSKDKETTVELLPSMTTEVIAPTSSTAKPTKPQTEPTMPSTVAPTTQTPTKPVETKPTVAPTTPAAPIATSITAKVSGSYYVGDTVPPSNITVIVKMSDGSSLTNPAGWSASTLTLNSTSNLIQLTYGGVSGSVTVNASTRPVETTAAPTTAAPTTEAPTTSAVVQKPSTGIYFYESDISTCNTKELSMKMFEHQNQLRIENGKKPLVWSDDIYNYAVAAATALGRYAEANGVSAAWDLNHNITEPYLRTNMICASGEEREFIYYENLQMSSYHLSRDGIFYLDMSKYINAASGFKDSPGHWAKVVSEKYDSGAIACYLVENKELDVDGGRMGGTMFISFLYWDSTKPSRY